MTKSEESYKACVSRLLQADSLRMACLKAVRALELPQGYIGAGFLRNAIWDHLHHKPSPTPLNDIDVIYFSKATPKQEDKALQARLSNAMPDVNWQVKNQAHMHTKHNHEPYSSCEHAISYWVERETCVAVRLTDNDQIDVLAPFGLNANFAETISLSPLFKRPDVMHKRVEEKGWLTLWPKLQLVT